MGRGTITMDYLRKFSKPQCIVSAVDTDPRLGGEFVLLLAPLERFGEPVYYWHERLDGTFVVEGEGYIITGDIESKISKRRRDISKKYSGKSLTWIQIHENGTLVNAS